MQIQLHASGSFFWQGGVRDDKRAEKWGRLDGMDGVLVCSHGRGLRGDVQRQHYLGEQLGLQERVVPTPN